MEGKPLSFTVGGRDTDAGQTLSYSLLCSVPSGASINPTTGLFSWTPLENQGPGAPHHFSVRVSDNGTRVRWPEPG